MKSKKTKSQLNQAQVDVSKSKIESEVKAHPKVIKKIINTYVKNRHQDEVFIDCVSRIGLEPFKEEVYGKKEKSV